MDEYDIFDVVSGIWGTEFDIDSYNDDLELYDAERAIIAKILCQLLNSEDEEDTARCLIELEEA
jgi:hypothetical protein